MSARGVNRRSALQALGAFAALAGTGGALAAEVSLAAIKARGTLVAAVYRDMPPFQDKGQGIDVDIAAALADALGVKLSLLSFPAGEDMDDDLRNMVWKGHYLGFGPADVMLHVPVEKPLMAANPQVRIFAPYWRDRVMIARRVDQLPHLETLAQLNGKSVAVPGQTLAGWLMIGADGGAYKQQLATTWKDGVEAAQALRRGEFAAAAGLESELESVLGDDPRFVITPLPTLHNSRAGWAVGLAVKKEAGELAAALQGAVDGLVADRRMQKIFSKGNVPWRAV
ncbi:MAG: transporter substrate-binding domain-containing protein [Betaproteobacteria bacterium]